LSKKDHRNSRANDPQGKRHEISAEEISVAGLSEKDYNNTDDIQWLALQGYARNEVYRLLEKNRKKRARGGLFSLKDSVSKDGTC
jgi:hypothetical protein